MPRVLMYSRQCWANTVASLIQATDIACFIVLIQRALSLVELKYQHLLSLYLNSGRLSGLCRPPHLDLCDVRETSSPNVGQGRGLLWCWVNRSSAMTT